MASTLLANLDTVNHTASSFSTPVDEFATDTSMWRVLPPDGPLVPGDYGTLDHARVAVKDLFAVAGQRVGAGNPTWLAAAPVEPAHADAVASLLAAGADVTGIALTDELAFSLEGANVHYGTIPNPIAPEHICGGSTSGPAAAVAAGVADIGLGTDTAGSIRVPASYCGLYGLRTTHDAVSRTGLLGLAPSFDTVGLLTRDLDLLTRAATALLPPQPIHPITTVLLVPHLIDLLPPAARAPFTAAVRALGAELRTAELPLPASQPSGPPPSESPAHRESISAATELRPDVATATALTRVLGAFRTVQAAEAWRLHGDFVTAHPSALAPEIAARFEAGRSVTPEAEADARNILLDTSKAWHAQLPPGTALALPAAASPAPRRRADPAEVEATRQATLRLTCHASLAGLPALTLPHLHYDGLPLGLCLLAAPGEDRSLLAFAAR